MKLSVFNKKKSVARGFTLLELIVVIVIFSIMTGIVLIDYRGFQQQIALDNLAQDVALTIRQAKIFASSASEFTGSSRRGISFQYIPLTGNYDTQFFVFADNDSGTVGVYDVDDTILDTVTIATGDRILDVCGGPISNPGQNCSTARDLNIVFTRAEHTALLDLGGTQYEAVQLIIGRDMSTTKRVIVLVSGQISVQQ